MDIERIEIAKLVSDPANARKHGDRNIDAIVASLTRFGQQKPIVVDKANVVRAGNGTLEAARSLGWTHLDCVRTQLDGSDAIAYAIADNKTAELAEWDAEVLAATLEGLNLEGMLETTGFDQAELDALLKEVGAELDPIEDDEIPEPPVDPITKPGDLWILGDHRLLCGDSTKAEDVARLMDGKKADLWLTDPPYNVDYTGKTKDALKIENDSMSESEFRQFLQKSFGLAFQNMKPGAAFYIWHADKTALAFLLALDHCQQKCRQILVWVKSCLVMNRTDYQPKHEPCIYGWKDGAAHAWFSDRKQTTVLEFEKPARSESHATTKPVPLFAYQIGNSTGPQGVVLDSFGGSGTTLLATEQLGRTSCLMELNPAHCDVIVQRWEKLTGKVAVRDTRHTDDAESIGTAVADQTGVSSGDNRKTGKNRSRSKQQPA